MKKKILAIALAVVLVAVAGYSTLAYFTAADNATNQITADTLSIQINEYQTGSDTPVAEGAEGLTIVVADVVPGDVVSKIPKVLNPAGNTSAWIRVKVTLTCIAADGTTVLLTAPITLDMGSNWSTTGDAKDIWYYNAAINGGKETTALFENVSFDLKTMDNDYQGAVVTIVLKAQAVQSAHNGGTDVFTAAGWPTF